MHALPDVGRIRWALKRGLVWGLAAWAADDPVAVAECQSGMRTTLVSETCVNAIRSERPRLSWSDPNARCTPGSFMCVIWADSQPVTLSRARCEDVHILEWIPEDRLAKIKCESARPGASGGVFFINSDLLTCSSQNVSAYQKPMTEVEENPASSFAGARIVQLAEKKRSEIQEKVNSDFAIVEGLAGRKEPLELWRAILQGRDQLGRLQEAVSIKKRFNWMCQPLDGRKIEDEKDVRAQSTCRLLNSSYVVGTLLLKEAERGAQREPGRSPEERRGRALKKKLLSLGARWKRDRPVDALGLRMLLFYSLKKEIPFLPGQLQLIRKADESGASSEETPSEEPYLWEVHSGFVFGGRNLPIEQGSGMDCTDFISSLIFSMSEDSSWLSTRILKRVAQYLEGRNFEVEQKGIREGQQFNSGIRRLTKCFSRVDLRQGELPSTGDVIVSRSEVLENGHAALVRRSLSSSQVETIESLGGGVNGVVHQERSLVEPLPRCAGPQERAPFRSDLYVLRLKDPPEKGCPLKLDSSEAEPDS